MAKELRCSECGMLRDKGEGDPCDYCASFIRQQGGKKKGGKRNGKN